MSYNSHNVTPIDSLPELEDLEGPRPFTQAVRGADIKASRYPGSSMIPEGDQERYGKFIRHTHAMPYESGMINQDTPPPMIPLEGGGESMPNAREGPVITNMPYNSPTCLEVADHIANCPLCSKFYNNDKTIYIIAIAVLIIICIMLLKRVLDV